MGLTRIALSRPIFIFMLIAATFLLGYISLRGMRVEEAPDVSFGTITIQTVYPGGSPQEVSTLVSKRIEEAVSGVNGVLEVTSTSREGISTVVVQLELGVDEDASLNDTRSKIDAILNELPEDVEKPTITKFDTSSEPVLYMTLSSDKTASRDLRDIIDDKLLDRFARIPGVANAAVQGGDVREIQIRIKKDSLLAYSIGINDVLNAVQTATLNVPSGKIIAEDEEYAVRVLGEFETVDQIRNMVFTVSDPDNPLAKKKIVRLSDVADVYDAVEERTSFSRLDGEDTIVIVLQKAKEGNAIEITERADNVIASIERDYSEEGIKIVKTQVQATRIQESIADLTFALIFGIVLVSTIVYVFLHNLRGTIIVSLAIPTSIFGTFITLNLFGFTINNLSMLALSLAIGVLVDDAIVILENIYRHLRMGEDPREAALKGRAEIGLAAIAITMADVVVFLPIAFMGGIVGAFFKPLAMGFVFAVLFSLFVSFTLTPLLASRWYRRGEDWEHAEGWFASRFNNGFQKFEKFYERVLEWALHHRWFVFISGNIALLAVFMFIAGSFVPEQAGLIQGAFGASKQLFTISVVIGLIVFIVNIFRGYFNPRFLLYGALFGLIFPLAAGIGFAYRYYYKQETVFKFAFLNENDPGSVNVAIELPPSASLEATSEVIDLIEERIAGHPDIKYVLSSIGTQAAGQFETGNSGSNYGRVQITLNDKRALLDTIRFWVKHEEELRTKSSEAVAADMLEKIGRIPGVAIKISTTSSSTFGVPIQMSFASDDRDLLLDTVSTIRRRLQDGAIEGVINVDITSKPGKPELRAIPDRTLLADADTTVQEVGAAMRTLYQGNNDTKFRVGGREYGIRVMMDLEDRNNPSLISEVPIKFVRGKPVYVEDVAQIKEATGVDKIDRRNREEEVRLEADLLPGFAAGSSQAQISQWLERENLVPEGVHIKELGQADAQNREMGFLFSALGIGLVLVYMLLASLYDNLLYPFIIQLSQPQAMVGALLALMLTDKALNIVGFIGIITLVGLVGKNAILLVDYTNTLRDRGRNRHDALVEAGPVRLRPIMMTTLALILGMLPVALAIGRGSAFRETIGITIIGGITLSTVLTLVVIPCSYTIFDDISLSLGRLLQRFGVHRESESAEDLPSDEVS